jgi:hypothetical protein
LSRIIGIAPGQGGAKGAGICSTLPGCVGSNCMVQCGGRLAPFMSYCHSADRCCCLPRPPKFSLWILYISSRWKKKLNEVNLKLKGKPDSVVELE